MATIRIAPTQIQAARAYNHVDVSTVQPADEAVFRNDGKSFLVIFPDTPAAPLTVTIHSFGSVAGLSIEDRTFTTVDSEMNILPSIPLVPHNDANGDVHVTVSALCDIGVMTV